MARSITCLLGSFFLWLTITGTAAGQAAVEYGIGAAHAATTAAPAQGIGKAMSGLAGSLDKAVKAGQQASDGQPVAATNTKTAAKTTAKTMSPSAHTSPPPVQTWEDPSGIQTGLSYGELVRRFGPPALEISGEMGRFLTYSGKNRAFQLEVQDGKVTSVLAPKS